MKAYLKMGRFLLVRSISLIITVTIAVYLTIYLANWGGNLDKAREANILYNATMEFSDNPVYQAMPREEVKILIEDRYQQERQRLNLDKPFIYRSFMYLGNAMTLNLGRSEQITSDSGSRKVKNVLLERIPTTLLLLGTTSMVTFFLSLYIGLFLSRHYGGILDKLTVALAPISAAPAWLYGIFLILVFASVLKLLPWGGLVDVPPPSDTLSYALSVLKHMVLPLTAMLISTLFSSVYARRTFFLIYSNEDYIDLARAKGLSPRALERRYILRPTLPPIVTQFVLVLINMWMGATVLETVFRWPGIGKLFFEATQLNDTPVIVGTVVIFGYMLALSVLLLDFIYAALDPRVRLGSGGGN